jgi:integrase
MYYMMATNLSKQPSGRTGVSKYCNWCNQTVTSLCKKLNKDIRKCKWKEYQKWKATCYHEGRRFTKILEAKDFHEAVIEKQSFERELKVNNFQRVPIEEKNESTPKLLIHCFARYIGFLNNEGVDFHFTIERTKEHIKDVERTFKEIVLCLHLEKVDMQTLTIDQVNDKIIGIIRKYYKEKNYSGRTINKKISYGVSCFKWFGNEYYPIKNWFARGKREEEVNNSRGIDATKYKALLNVIKPSASVKLDNSASKGRRYMYRDWLLYGIQLGLETGRRREEIAMMRWSDIETNDIGEPLLIVVDDIKVNRIKHLEINKKKIYVPVTNDLLKLLLELGYKNYKNSDQFILAPGITRRRGKTISDTLSRGFSHFYSLVDKDEKLTFRSLRKTYISSLMLWLGDPTRITGHSNISVVNKFYKVEKQIALAIRNFKVFPEETDRKKELKKARKNNIETKKQLNK